MCRSVDRLDVIPSADALNATPTPLPPPPTTTTTPPQPDTARNVTAAKPQNRDAADGDDTPAYSRALGFGVLRADGDGGARDPLPHDGRCEFGDIGMINTEPRPTATRKTGGIPSPGARLLFITFTVAAVVASTIAATAAADNYGTDAPLHRRRGPLRHDAACSGDGLHDPHHVRSKRQLPPIEVGNQLVDSIFQIPISTLNAVGTVIKASRPLVRFTRERIQQYYNTGSQQSGGSQQQYGYNKPMSQYGYNVQTYYGNNNNNNNRKKQQRDDPLPEGRSHRHSVSTDY